MDSQKPLDHAHNVSRSRLLATVQNHVEDTVSVPLHPFQQGGSLIPVQIPDRPFPTSPGTQDSKYGPASFPSPLSPVANLPRLGGPPAILHKPGDNCDSEPSSPSHSDLSRHSEESIVIVGDTFSAPTSIKLDWESTEQLTNAGCKRYTMNRIIWITIQILQHLTGIIDVLLQRL